MRLERDISSSRTKGRQSPRGERGREKRLEKEGENFIVVCLSEVREREWEVEFLSRRSFISLSLTLFHCPLSGACYMVSRSGARGLDLSALSLILSPAGGLALFYREQPAAWSDRGPALRGAEPRRELPRSHGSQPAVRRSKSPAHRAQSSSGLSADTARCTAKSAKSAELPPKPSKAAPSPPCRLTEGQRLAFASPGVNWD